MRGRLQANGAAALASALPIVGWLGTAIVALVVLRQGLKDGLLVLLWAALPLVLIYQTGGDASGLAAVSGVFLLAMVLRLTTSWELTLLAAVGVAAAGSWAFAILSAPILAAFAQWYVETLSALAADAGVAGVTLEEGKWFGSVTVRDIADAATATGTEIDRSEVRLPAGPLREVGEYQVEIYLHPEVSAELNVVVEAEEAFPS